MELFRILDNATQNTHSPKGLYNGVPENSSSTMSYLSSNHFVVETMVSVLPDTGGDLIYGCEIDQRSVLYFFPIEFKRYNGRKSFKTLLSEAAFHTGRSCISWSLTAEALLPGPPGCESPSLPHFLALLWVSVQPLCVCGVFHLWSSESDQLTSQNRWKMSTKQFLMSIQNRAVNKVLVNCY